jgi:trimeric autotransporter adhesin
MKKLYILLVLIATIATFAQAPQGFNYQATVRNSTGALIVNQIVLVKFKVYQNSATGTLVYSENQTATTDDLGHIALVVGQGTATTGTFSTINWGTGQLLFRDRTEYRFWLCSDGNYAAVECALCIVCE